MIDLGRIGLWTFAFDRQPWPEARAALEELDAVSGIGCLWFPEATNRNAFVNATLFLANTSRIAVATGVAPIHNRDATATANAQRTLEAVFPGRFLLGLGVSHAWLVEDVRGGRYGPPLASMRAYLEAIDQAPYTAYPENAPVRPRVIAALGPRMLEVARDLADGAHPYLTTPEHTASARAILGPDKILAPDQKIVLTSDPGTAREIARMHLSGYLGQPNYRNSFLRQGFSEADVDGGGSDRLVDAIVAWGPVESIVARVQAHLDAGASHVAVQVLTADYSDMPLDQWRLVSDALGS
jgi:probable F420-dependent oxidoreductase